MDSYAKDNADLKEQSDTPETGMAEGKGLNPYFEGRFDGESDDLRDLRLTLARERDEARAALSKFMEWLEKDEAGPQYSTTAEVEAIRARGTT